MEVELSSSRGGLAVVKTPYTRVSIVDLEGDASVVAKATKSGGIRLETRKASRYRLNFH